MQFKLCENINYFEFSTTKNVLSNYIAIVRLCTVSV